MRTGIAPSPVCCIIVLKFGIILSIASQADAEQEAIGFAGEAHILMLGIDKMSDGMAVSRLEDCWRTSLVSGKGLDTVA